MIPPIRRQPAPVECATPPDPTPHIQAWPRPPRTHFWHRPRPHAAPSPLRRSPAPEPHPDEKGAFCGRFAGLRPVVLRERVGFQSNAQMRGTRSTGNLRVRRERGRPGGTRRWVRPPGTGPGAEILLRLRSRAPGEVIGVGAGPGGVVQAGAAPAARPVDTLPGRSEGADCQNLPQRPRSSRRARKETLIFRASVRRQSRRRAPLWQIWTRPRPEPPQKSHPPHHDGAPQRQTPARGRRRPASGPSLLFEPDIGVPEPENTGRPGPDVVQLARGLRCRCRCRRQSASGSGGWSCRRRGRRRRPGAPPSAGRIRQRAPG